MKKLGGASIALALLLCPVQPGMAQGEREALLGSRIDRAKPAHDPYDMRLSDIDRARMVVDRFAACLLTAQPRRVSEYVALKYDDLRARKLLRSVVTSDCLAAGGLTMPNDLLRGALFKALYIRDKKASAPALAAKPVDFAAYVSHQKAALRYLVLMDFAGCMVRADGANAAAYVRADPGSAEEKAALAALQPNLGPCYPAGADAVLNKSMMTAVLAEALYREMQAGSTEVAEAAR